ncbi:hypothetical protein [Breoghania sp.]|uniref:hypothetical protein n=1 Tax=Breoghania sp. TaxID=2065378 RepID=UPI0029C64325|nr:hypothetical protein [Breoghania sp.]
MNDELFGLPADRMVFECRDRDIGDRLNIGCGFFSYNQFRLRYTHIAIERAE